MKVFTEAVEVCPHCEGENVFPNWNVLTQGYVARCQHCGAEIMLCDECMHAEDNPGRKCDWHGFIRPEGQSEGRCFRGSARNEAGFISELAR